MRVVNPNPEEYRNLLTFPVKLLANQGTPLADVWLPVRINGDMAALRGIMKEMLAEEEKRPGQVFDQDFIRDFTGGYDAFVQHLRASRWKTFSPAAASRGSKSALRRRSPSIPNA